jgi:predicted unusual protein kinase regulating ubiquinone biosynthesis (AarF/ABC1/UbiB family)
MMEELEILKHILNMFIHFGRREVDEAMSMLLDMERTALDETDYRCEMKNMRTFRQAFREESSIVVPRVSRQWTSTRVLTMEYIPSKKVTSMTANNNMSSTLMRTFMKTVINHGYLHCDPHPGNIGVMSDGKLVLYDYGMVARLQTNIRATMRRLSIALISRDTETLGNLLFGEDIIRGALSGATNVNELHPHEYTTFYRLCRHVYAYMDNLDAHEFVRKISNDRLIDSANLPIKLNPNVFFLFRSFAVLEGVCKTIDPNFNYHTIIMEMTVEMMDLEIFMEKARVDMRNSVRGDDSNAYIARLESVAENMATENAVNRMLFGTMFFGMLVQMCFF